MSLIDKIRSAGKSRRLSPDAGRECVPSLDCMQLLLLVRFGFAGLVDGCLDVEDLDLRSRVRFDVFQTSHVLLKTKNGPGEVDVEWLLETVFATGEGYGLVGAKEPVPGFAVDLGDVVAAGGG